MKQIVHRFAILALLAAAFGVINTTFAMQEKNPELTDQFIGWGVQGCSPVQLQKTFEVIATIWNNKLTTEQQIEMIKKLIEQGACINDVVNSSRFERPITTALREAIHRNDIDLIKFFVDKCDANINETIEKNIDPLHNIVEYVLEAQKNFKLHTHDSLEQKQFQEQQKKIFEYICMHPKQCATEDHLLDIITQGCNCEEKIFTMLCKKLNNNYLKILAKILPAVKTQPLTNFAKNNIMICIECIFKQTKKCATLIEKIDLLSKLKTCIAQHNNVSDRLNILHIKCNKFVGDLLDEAFESKIDNEIIYKAFITLLKNYPNFAESSYKKNNTIYIWLPEHTIFKNCFKQKLPQISLEDIELVMGLVRYDYGTYASYLKVMLAQYPFNEKIADKVLNFTEHDLSYYYYQQRLGLLENYCDHHKEAQPYFIHKHDLLYGDPSNESPSKLLTNIYAVLLTRIIPDNKQKLDTMLTYLRPPKIRIHFGLRNDPTIKVQLFSQSRELRDKDICRLVVAGFLTQLQNISNYKPIKLSLTPNSNNSMTIDLQENRETKSYIGEGPAKIILSYLGTDIKLFYSFEQLIAAEYKDALQFYNQGKYHFDKETIQLLTCLLQNYSDQSILKNMILKAKKMQYTGVFQTEDDCKLAIVIRIAKAITDYATDKTIMQSIFEKLNINPSINIKYPTTMNDICHDLTEYHFGSYWETRNPKLFKAIKEQEKVYVQKALEKTQKNAQKIAQELAIIIKNNEVQS